MRTIDDFCVVNLQAIGCSNLGMLWWGENGAVDEASCEEYLRLMSLPMLWRSGETRSYSG
jgi:hypothetical protein